MALSLRTMLRDLPGSRGKDTSPGIDRPDVNYARKALDLCECSAIKEPRKIEQDAMHDFQTITRNRVHQDPMYERLEELLVDTIGLPRIKEVDTPAPRISRKFNQHELQHSKGLRNAGIRKSLLHEADPESSKLRRPAYHKRACTEADLDDFRKLRPPLPECNIEELSLHGQARARESDEEASDRQRSLSPLVHYAWLEVGHEAASAMSGKSPGKRKHSKTPKDTANDLTSPLPTTVLEVHEIGDSQDEYENEGKVESSRRVTPNTRKKRHSTDPHAVKPATDEPPEYAHSLENGRDPSYSQKTKEVSKKRDSWSALTRYKSGANSMPDYSMPTNHTPITATDFTEIGPARAMRSSYLSGPTKPINTLSRSIGNSNPSPVFTNRRVNKPAEGFDLCNGDDSGRPDQYSNKKRKTQDEAVSRAAQAHRDVIDLEVGSTHKTPSRSGNSYTQNSQSRSSGSKNPLPVQEYRSLETHIKGKQQLRRKNGRASNGQLPKTSGVRQQTSDVSHRTSFKHFEPADAEDSKEPISDSDLDVVGPEVRKKSSLRVVIETRPPPQRVSSPRPARVGPPGKATSTSENVTDLTDGSSPYFNGQESGSNGRNHSISSSVVELTQDKIDSMRQQNRGSIKRKRVVSAENNRRQSDASMDELAEVGCQEVAQGLPARSRRQKNPLTATKIMQEYDVNDEVSDDDGQAAEKPKTNHAKKQKLKQAPRENRFHILQIFSERKQWLLPGKDLPWKLNWDSATGNLIFFDSRGIIVKDLTIMSNAITKILYDGGKKDGKLELHKTRDSTPGTADKIWMEFRDFESGYSFCHQIQKFASGVALVPKASDNLRKTFENISSKYAKIRCVQGKPDPRDVQDAKQNSNTMVSENFDKAKIARERGLRIIDRLGNHETTQHEAKPLSRANRTRSSSEVFEVDSEEHSRPPNTSKSSSDGFLDNDDAPPELSNDHGTRASRRVSGKEPPHRYSSMPRSPSPERWTDLHPDWGERWRRSIIYPQEGKNKATVDQQDIPRLDEGNYLNDNLIMFYLLWLEQNLAQKNPDLSNRVYFHNTFFYERLSNPVKGKKGINYEAVERWTSKVDLLKYDYIIVPVNEHNHWYVAIICNAPKLLNPEPEVIEDSQSQEMSSGGRENPIDPEGSPKSSSTSPLKTRPESPSETGVGGIMKQMSLNDRADDDSLVDDPLTSKFGRTSPQQQNGPNGNSPSLEHFSGEPDAQKSPSAILKGSLKQAIIAKKGKRKSYTPRRYDPRQPRIITLDSLGLKHSPTCTNLRDYLVAEIKSKHSKDISPPIALGTTAIGLPKQNNHCDCGLFLLSYIEYFLKRPDQLVEAILQEPENISDELFTKAPRMRNRIRKLLFDLQAEQNKEDELKKATGKGKMKQMKTEIAPKSNSRVASASASTSVTPDRSTLNRVSAQPGIDTAQDHSKQSLQTPIAMKDSASKHPLQSARREMRALIPRSPPGPENVDGQVADAEERLGSGKATSKTSDNQAAPAEGWNVFSTILSTFAGFEKAIKATDMAQPKRSYAHAIQMEDFPEQASQVVHQATDNDSPSTPLRGWGSQPNKELISPSPEPTERHSNLRNRQPTPHPGRNYRHVSEDLDEPQTWNGASRVQKSEDRSIKDSSPLEPAPKPISKYVDMTLDDEIEDKAREDDKEMLFTQDTIHAPDEPATPALLDNSSGPSTPVMPHGKKRSVASLQRGRSHKSTLQNALSQPIVVRQDTTRLTDGRDPLENAMTRKYVGTRIHFPD